MHSSIALGLILYCVQVHERSVDSDFLLLELRDILQRNKKIKVILVSNLRTS